MTTPGGSAPDGAYVVGSSFGSDITEQSAMGMATNGAMNSWDQAQKNMKSEFVSAQLVNGEVVRLDNRIDEIILGTERAFLYTYSESAVWEKHPAAYKIVVDVLSGSTGGTMPSGAPGKGGYGGGWERKEFTGEDLENLPNLIAITVGNGTEAGSFDQAGSSSFGSYVVSTGATQGEYGTGSRTYKMRGGDGGGEATSGTAGSAGPFDPGGSGGARADGFGGNGQRGGHGFSVDPGQIGPGSSGGGGGGGWGVISAGASGGHGGWPAGAGGGRGRGQAGLGTSGNGAWGAVFVTVYVQDTLGSPPSIPTNLVASNVTSTSARVTWEPSIDDILVKNYVLFLNGSRYGVVMNTYNDFVGLAPNTQYTVRIQAVDMGDNASELSDPLLFTTLA